MTTLDRTHAEADRIASWPTTRRAPSAPPPQRRRRAALQNLVIRAVSLAIFLTLWQIAGVQRRPGAVHHAVRRSRSRRST